MLFEIFRQIRKIAVIYGEGGSRTVAVSQKGVKFCGDLTVFPSLVGIEQAKMPVFRCKEKTVAYGKKKRRWRKGASCSFSA